MGKEETLNRIQKKKALKNCLKSYYPITLRCISYRSFLLVSMYLYSPLVSFYKMEAIWYISVSILFFLIGLY